MQRIRLALAGVVTVIWAVGYVLSFTEGKVAPTEVTGLMALVLGWAFAGQIKDSIRRKNGNGDRGEDER